MKIKKYVEIELTDAECLGVETTIKLIEKIKDIYPKDTYGDIFNYLVAQRNHESLPNIIKF